jgi:hypothetical protein
VVWVRKILESLLLVTTGINDEIKFVIEDVWSDSNQQTEGDS